jgi:magnesium transporter
MLQLFPKPPDPAAAAMAGVVWIDLLDPTDSEIELVESSTGLRVPTRSALAEIESTSRNYQEGGAIYLSSPLIARASSLEGALTPVGFVLAPRMLITVRFEPLVAFDEVAAQAAPTRALAADELFVSLLEHIVDKGADLLEHAGLELDRLSYAAFHSDRVRTGQLNEANTKLREALRSVGRMADRTSQIRDSLLGLGRITGYVVETGCHGMHDDLRLRLSAVRADVASLNDYQSHLANKIQFLLDATLGFISIEQNDIVKVLTVASIVGVPPVLVAGIYGMNFKIMPEYNWAYGYPYSLVLMLLSAVIPLIWFKWRGWI